MNKHFLMLLISITLYVGYTTDLEQKVKQLSNQLMLINVKIYQNNQLLKYKEKILKQIKEKLKIAKTNEKKNVFSKNK
ncbi:MAG TPA: hypothetical protein EYP82_01615 [Hydrogenothermaceae bacterium]|nr:hypothetical protein [Hydrogenothermaceae bacterium]